MDRIESMLGLATKAGKTAGGLYLTLGAVRSGKAGLVLMAEDAKANTRKTLRDKCTTYGIPLREYGTKERLGTCMGKGERACVAVMDAGFADHIEKLLDQAGR